MFGSVQAFYESIAAGTRSLSKGSAAVKTVKLAGAGVAGSYIAKSIIRAPRSMSERLYPQASQNMGAGKYGLNAGSPMSDLGAEGLKFSFKKKR